MTPGSGQDVEARPGSERAADWRELYDGSDLATWELGVYGESDEYEVREDGVVIPQTAALAGMTFRGDLPRVPYRLSVEATRLYGADFFLGVTFPVSEGHLTLVLGGWGGMVSGLSSLDGLDASRNATRTLRHFADGDRHEVEIEVTGTDVRVLVDGEAFLATSLVDREVGLGSTSSPRTRSESRPTPRPPSCTGSARWSCRRARIEGGVAVRDAPEASLAPRQLDTP